MKSFLSKIKNFLNRDALTREAQKNGMLHVLKDLEKRAIEYKESDPYLAGLNAGRAQMLEYMLETIFK